MGREERQQQPGKGVRRATPRAKGPPSLARDWGLRTQSSPIGTSPGTEPGRGAGQSQEEKQASREGENTGQGSQGDKGQEHGFKGEKRGRNVYVCVCVIKRKKP